MLPLDRKLKEVEERHNTILSDRPIICSKIGRPLLDPYFLVLNALLFLSSIQSTAK
jgi:hypothetical protein